MAKKQDCIKEILLKKKERLNAAQQLLPLEELKARVKDMAPARPFFKAINKPNTLSLIAEIKKASPSKGVLREDFHPQDIARIYQDAGVQALSVLTEEDFFLGNPAYIQEVKTVVQLPVLRKDFIIEPYQIYESRYLGADAVLLIAELLSKEKIVNFLQIASELGMECLVEAHTEKELKKLLNLKNPLLGVNNRSLKTFEVDLKITERLFPMIPREKVVVVESGLHTYQDILFLKILGVKAVLIGSAFMEAPDIKKKVEEIMGW